MKKIYVVLAVAALLGVSSCGWTRKSLGLAQSGLDETLVQTNKPLILPPEYDVRPHKQLIKSDTDSELEDEDSDAED